jgi:hypothetical protein
MRVAHKLKQDGLDGPLKQYISWHLIFLVFARLDFIFLWVLGFNNAKNKIIKCLDHFLCWELLYGTSYTVGTFVTLWLWQQVRDVDTSVRAKQNNFFVQISL